MTKNIDEDVIERLEAEVLTSDADPEELSLYAESDVAQKQEEIEELEGSVEEKESEISEKEEEIEELQEMTDEKDEKIEELREEVNAVAETYAEELASDTELMTAEELMERYDFEELREKHDEMFDGASPNPQSGDPGAGFQSPDNEGGDNGGNGGEPEELSEKAKVAADQFRTRAKKTGNSYWAELAEDIEEDGLGEVRRPGENDDEIFQ